MHCCLCLYTYDYAKQTILENLTRQMLNNVRHVTRAVLRMELSTSVAGFVDIAYSFNWYKQRGCWNVQF